MRQAMGALSGCAVTTNGMAKYLACLRLARLDLIREGKEGPSCGTNLAGLELLGTVLARHGWNFPKTFRHST